MRSTAVIALLSVAARVTFAAPALIFCEDQQDGHGVQPCATVSASELLNVPLPLQTSILMALAPNVKFDLDETTGDLTDDYPADTTVDSFSNQRPEPVRELPSSPSNWVPLLNFIDRAREVTERLTHGSNPIVEDDEAEPSAPTGLPPPPHKPLVDPDVETEEYSVDGTLGDGGKAGNEPLPSILDQAIAFLTDLKTLPVHHLLIGLAGVTLISYLLAECFECLFARLRRNRSSSRSQYRHHRFDSMSKTKV